MKYFEKNQWISMYPYLKRINCTMSPKYFKYYKLSQNIFCLFVFLASISNQALSSANEVLPALAYADVRSYGAKGDGISDDTVAIQNALKNNRNVLIPKGKYLVKELVIYNNTRLLGITGQSVLKNMEGSTFILSAYVNNKVNNNNSNTKNIEINGITFEGRSVEDGFSEHEHNLRLVAVSNATITNCTFHSFRGDGIYIGTIKSGIIRSHNNNISVSRCYFDGVNYKNRNAISIIDGTTISITDSKFTRTANNKMPGAIDIEPNSIDETVNDINISRNSFKNIGGNVGVISFVLRKYEPPNENNKFNYIINDNSIESSSTGITILYRPEKRSEQINLKSFLISNNNIKLMNRPIDLQGVYGAVIENNDFSVSKLSAKIGAEGELSAVNDIQFKSNKWFEIGRYNSTGIEIYSANKLTFLEDELIDCGMVIGNISNPIYFKKGNSSYIQFIRTKFITTNKLKFVYIQKSAEHLTQSETNSFKNCTSNTKIINRL